MGKTAKRGWRRIGTRTKPSNPAKRQAPKKFTKAEKQVLQILIRNRRKIK
jgi:hypothetical protein